MFEWSNEHTRIQGWVNGNYNEINNWELWKYLTKLDATSIEPRHHDQYWSTETSVNYSQLVV